MTPLSKLLSTRYTGFVIGASLFSTILYASNDTNNIRVFCDEMRDISKRLITVTPEATLFLFGDNYYGVADPLSDSLSIKFPQQINISGSRSLSSLNYTLASLYESRLSLSELKNLFGSRIKGVAMAKKHAACIDPSGDLIQWGHGFNGLINFIENAPQLEDSSILSTSPVSPAKRDIIISGFEGPEYINRSPEPTIVGHNLVLVATTKEHIIAVNDEQKLFISDGVREKPWLKKSPSISCDSIESSSAPSGAFGWIKNWLFTASSKPFVADTVQIVDLPFLSKTEKIVQLVSGDHYVVLLSNHGNVFTMAIDTHSNMFGQLGYDSLKSKDSDLDALVLFKVPSPAQQLTTGEMIQNAIEASDSLLRPNPKKLKGQEPQRIKWRDSIAELDGSTAERLHRPLFCKVDLGNKIAEIAAGTHHTLLRTASGQVWGFGANGYGQLGKLLGVVNMTPIVVNAPFSTPITGIWAGGDTSAFLTESSPGNLAECYTTGAGMWGQLGNNSFRQCQFEMVPVTDISRLSYYNESTGRISPIALNSLSIGRTHLAATMQTRVDNDGVLPRFGFNVFTWGSNHAFQLGNGKRAMASKPIQPDALPVIQDEFTKDGIQEHERATPSDQKVGLQIFPGILKKGSEEYVVPPQRIICGVDTTAIF